MINNAQQLISDFKEKGWKADKLYEHLFELSKNPEEIFGFAKEYLKVFDKNATLFNDALSYIDKEHFDELISISLKILEIKKNENAESVIEYGSLQFPELLHKHLELIFSLKPNKRAYSENYPWRNLNRNKIEVFKKQLIDKETSIEDRQKLFRCLLETRNLGTITFAINYALENNLFDNVDLEQYLVNRLEFVGFTKQGNRIQNYCPNPVRHFLFAKDYFPDNRPIHTNRNQHPTWRLKPHEIIFKFGGIIENDSKNPFFHLISFDRVPDWLNVTNLDSLVLGVHIRQLNECGAIFYQHEKNGAPLKISSDYEIEIYFDSPIKETTVSFADTPKRWEFQSWGSANSRENLFRIGGEPTWIQNPEVLVCPICNEKMVFVMQLDSDLPDVEGEELMFGSGGICYVFWCDKSKVSGYVMQCT